MKFILHIGMGKTGSSAIQAALRLSGNTLKEQGAVYLGQWFDFVDPRFAGLKNQFELYQLPEHEREDFAGQLLAALRSRSKADSVTTFVLSNEALSGQSWALRPILRQLQEGGVEVAVTGYVRNPSGWLPSAYIQWGIRDKTREGDIPSYSEMARKLVGWYRGLLDWKQAMPDVVDIRHYDRTPNIVTDFSDATGLELITPPERVLERGEDAEVVLRALFNRQFTDAVLPHRFDRAVSLDLSSVPSLAELVERTLDFSETRDIVDENKAVFERYQSTVGIDLLQAQDSSGDPPSHEALRDRLFDALLVISMDQARRISQLENKVHRLLKAEEERAARKG